MNPLTILARIGSRLLAAPAWVAARVDAHYAGALGGEDE